MKKIAALAFLGVLVAVPLRLPGWGEAEPPTAAESRRMGWQPAATFDELARDVYERVNDERAARGLAPLAWDDDLAALAQGWSEHMIEAGVYEHAPDSYRSHPRFAGGNAENIALGYETSAELHLGWMHSEGHRRNILDRNLDAIGIGIVCRNDGILWATQIFGRYEPGPPRPAAHTGEAPIIRQDAGIACPRSPWASQLRGP